MATLLMQNHPDTGSNTSHWYYELQYDIISQNVGANQTTVRFYIVVYSDNGAYTQSGTWVRSGWYPNSSNQIISSSSNPGTISSGHVTLNTADVTVGMDANGNYSAAAGYYLNTPGTEMFNKATTLTLPRLALAPPITSVIVDTVQPTSMRVGIEIGGFGHGTSCNMRAQYKQSSSGTWIDTPDQPDAAGYNYYTITGLIPGTSYDYRAVAYNNNGDQSISGSQSVTTLPAPNASTPLFKIIGLS